VTDAAGPDAAAVDAPANAILVVGLGNLIRTDDGIGIHAMRALAESPRLPANPSKPIVFIDGGTRGLQLVNDAAGASHVLVLDAIDTAAPPGTLVTLGADELASLPAGSTVHELGIGDWITALAVLTGRVPELRFLGLQPLDTGWGTSLTPALQQGLDGLVNAALDQLEEWVGRG
jgi:hydrogenase maturation protease